MDSHLLSGVAVFCFVFLYLCCSPHFAINIWLCISRQKRSSRFRLLTQFRRQQSCIDRNFKKVLWCDLFFQLKWCAFNELKLNMSQLLLLLYLYVSLFFSLVKTFRHFSMRATSFCAMCFSSYFVDVVRIRLANNKIKRFGKI